MTTGLSWNWRGQVPYAQAWAEQRSRREAIIARQADEVIWLLEHPVGVITTGRRPISVLPTNDQLADHGLELHRTERGGLATWHGPGQLMAYLLIRAQERGLGVRRMVCLVEEAIINWLDKEGIQAQRRDGYPGIWVGTDKICALGLHFRRGVSMHGLSLNLSPSFEGYDLIEPCGITDGGITSVELLTGQSRPMVDIATEIGTSLVHTLPGLS